MTLDEAIRWAGGTNAKLAELLNVPSQTITLWRRTQFLPAGRQYQIEVLSEGELKADRSAPFIRNRKEDVLRRVKDQLALQG